MNTRPKYHASATTLRTKLTAHRRECNEDLTWLAQFKFEQVVGHARAQVAYVRLREGPLRQRNEGGRDIGCLVEIQFADGDM